MPPLPGMPRPAIRFGAPLPGIPLPAIRFGAPIIGGRPNGGIIMGGGMPGIPKGGLGKSIGGGIPGIEGIPGIPIGVIIEFAERN
eukprot:CAMPEP_0197516220 /NCGR_PEP_ID=MMETSP1318-20131121/1061_1 /TAXON_ID=552666 /ORGANISM="Partenskyella glossopodia, Strain RCC365" /LENGTH=84 /DNA_ID=CAMNT_0043064759 /DNA_START=419 /DNA_END=673 /DNA_ORIENTATION=-